MCSSDLSMATDPYLATVSDHSGVLACAAHIAPFKVVITRAAREAIAALATNVFAAMPHVEGVTGPAQSVSDFALAWSKLSGVEPRLGTRLRIHETRQVVDSDPKSPPGRFRPATSGDQNVLASWVEAFGAEAKLPEPVDASRVVADGIRRGRLHVWDADRPVSMAAWAGKTPNGVRITLVYTPREFRGNGYATACVGALTTQQLQQGNAFCWLYTELSSGASTDIFRRIGYRPVSDVAEYYLK